VCFQRTFTPPNGAQNALPTGHYQQRDGMTDIIYGSSEQQVMMQRANALWSLVGADPRFCFQARTVSVGGEYDGAADLVISLTRLLGYASCHFTTRENAEAYAELYQAAGLQSVVWNQLWGRNSALQASAAFLSEYEAPSGCY
jgi:hypothetical protein